MYDELIKALRNMSKMGMKYGMAVVKMREAADAIEELQKRVPETPHGRLIDADFFAERMEGLQKQAMADGFDSGAFWYEAFVQHIKLSPTIIEAEGKGYILAPQEEYDGLKRKYVVLKSDTGECVENCFVLRPDKDKTAIAALLAYADATDNHVLAKDIRAWISTIPAEEGE